MRYFVKLTEPSKKGKYIQIYRTNYVPGKGNQNKSYKALGYVEDLKKQGIEDPVKYARQLVIELNEQEENTKIAQVGDVSICKNLGYFLIKGMFDYLDVDYIMDIFTQNKKFKFKMSDFVRTMVYAQIVNPGSKLKAFENVIPNIYGVTQYSYDQILDAIEFIGEDYQKYIELFNDRINKKWKRNMNVNYFDCTNYYFEIDLEDSYRKKGPSKEHRKTPIISMGLLMDKNGIPMYYDLFPGNESEKLQMRPTLKKTKAKFGIDRTIIVADRGQNTSDNTVFIAGKNDDVHTNHDGYVYGQSIIGAEKAFKNWVLTQEDYICEKIYDENGDLITYREPVTDETGKIIDYQDLPVIFKHKSRVIAKKIKIKKDNKRNVTYIIYQKQMVYYSKKYANRQKKEREKAIQKAKDLIANPSKYTQATSYGCTKYINNIRFNEETGEVPEGLELSLKLDKIQEEEKFDGYYSIVTSEKNLSDKELRDIYKGLWKIEETFKITKSELETRPIFVWTEESIEAHFLSCFIALLIIRLLEKKLQRKYSNEYIIDSLRKYMSTRIEHDIYLQNFRNDVIKDLEKVFQLDLSRKYLTLSEIKKKLNF